MPKSPDEMRVLLNAFQMEKAVYELGNELNNRAVWLRVPLAGIEQLLGNEVYDLDDAPQSRMSIANCKVRIVDDETRN
jgi:hypothetical protein